MTKLELIIKNADGSQYWIERFDSRLDLNLWLKTEQSRPYWKKEFVVEVIDNTAEFEKFEAERKARLEAEQRAERQKQLDVRAAVKAFKEKPSKTVADVVKVLEALIDLLDLKTDSNLK